LKLETWNPKKMAYDKFYPYSSAVPLPIENVDTDQIIPARFLKSNRTCCFGDNLSVTGDTTEMIILRLISVLNNPTYFR
jgi:3-isopropylmalate/(R)-2-methylmalate dehydratase small subunit